MNESLELPDGTLVMVEVDARGLIEYTVEPGKAGQCETTVVYTADDARRHAQTIRDREMASWDVIFPEEVEPVLAVARALERAARELDERGSK